MTVAVATLIVTMTCAREKPPRSLAEVTMTRGLTLAGSGDTLDLTRGSLLAIASSGAIAVAPVASTRGSVALYDAAGHLVRIFGRIGEGPGEFSMSMGQANISGLGFERGDTLVIGGGRARVSFFSPPPEARFVRSYVPPPTLAFFTGTPIGLLASSYFTGHRPGTTSRPVVRGGPIHGTVVPPRLFSWDGVPVADFGKVLDDATPDEMMGVITLVDSSRVWRAAADRYQLDLIGRGGEALRRINRVVPWFQRDTTRPNFPWVKPPPTSIKAISVGPDGTLWVLISRANRNWAMHRTLPSPVLKPGMPPQMFPQYRMDELFECVIEVLDPVSGVAIASKELSGDFTGFVAPGIIVEYVEDSTGSFTIQLWNLGVRRR